MAFPDVKQLEDATFDMVVAGRVVGDDVAIAMIEAEATDGAWGLVKDEGVAAPTEEERAQPYLWRFWRNIPRTGRSIGSRFRNSR